MLMEQSEEYVRQIEAEVERLQQLRNQVQVMIQSEEGLEESETGGKTRRKRAAKKSAGKKALVSKSHVKRGRPKNSPAVEA